MSHIQAVIVPLASKREMPRRGIAGFTLIELMIVVAVVAILSSIAIPAYQDSVRKARRAQAKADLVEYAGLAERFRTANNGYVTPTASFALPYTVSPRETGATAHYDLTLVSTASTFEITATPKTGQDKDRCGTLSLSQTGLKKETGSATLSECW